MPDSVRHPPRGVVLAAARHDEEQEYCRDHVHGADGTVVPVIVDAFGVVRNRAIRMDITPTIVPSKWSQKLYR
jgi:hypothetical protein